MTAFLVDTNAGRLARWLRLLGYDAAFYPRGDDRTLVALAAREDRVILTRDRGVAANRKARSVLLESDDWRAQLQQIWRAFGSACPGCERCMDCNTRLEERQPLPGQVPARVLTDQREFWWCAGCGRFFWAGSHLLKMREQLAALGVVQ